MLEPLMGSTSRENILFYLHFRKEGYAREISRFFKTGLATIQKQLERLETGGVLYSRSEGKTRLYGQGEGSQQAAAIPVHGLVGDFGGGYPQDVSQ